MTALTLGLWVRPWIRVEVSGHQVARQHRGGVLPARGLEARVSERGVRSAQADDLFWAARKMMAISDDAIRAAVETAEYSDPEAAAYLARRHHRAA